MTPFGWKWLAALLLVCSACAAYAWLDSVVPNMDYLHLF